MPDTVKAVSIDGVDYLLTADEGESRDWEAYSEEIRVLGCGADDVLPLCESVAEDAGMPLDELQADENRGRLTVTRANGFGAGGSCYEEVYGFGSRSFSILSTDGSVVFDSRAEHEQIIADACRISSTRTILSRVSLSRVSLSRVPMTAPMTRDQSPRRSRPGPWVAESSGSSASSTL